MDLKYFDNFTAQLNLCVRVCMRMLDAYTILIRFNNCIIKANEWKGVKKSGGFTSEIFGGLTKIKNNNILYHCYGFTRTIASKLLKTIAIENVSKKKNQNKNLDRNKHNF